MKEVLIWVRGHGRVRTRAEQRKTAEEAPRVALDRLGGQRSQLVVPVGLEEGAETDAVMVESVEELIQGAFAAYFADNEVRMFLSGGQERAGCLRNGVAGLDYLLGRRKVLAN